MKKRLIAKCIILLSFISVLVVPPLAAKEWPSQPITLIIGWSAGGSSDIISRLLADSMSKTLGVPVVVDNKTGASGHISLNAISKAKPDGYTIGFLSTNAVTEQPFFLKNLPFDPVNGFSYIASVFKYGTGWVVKSDAKWKNFKEFIDDAVKRPGKITVGMTGVGSTQRVALGSLEATIPGLRGALALVQFKGGIPAVTALLGGHVDSCFHTAEWKPYVDSGELRILVLPEKNSEFPNAQTFADFGYGAYPGASGAYVGPPGLPEPIRAKLQQAIKKAVDEQGFDEKGIKPFTMIKYYKPGPEAYAELMAKYEANKKLIPPMNIQVPQ